MKKYLFIVLLVGVCFGQIKNSELEKCANIKDEMERLACYDEISYRHDLVKLEKVNSNIDGKGKWSINISENPLDDSKTTMLSLYANSGANYLGEKPMLGIRCKSGELSIMISWETFLNNDDVLLTTRLGNNKAIKELWGISSSLKTSFHPAPYDFFDKLIHEQKYVAKVTPYNSTPITAVFDLSGISKISKAISESCNKSLLPEWVQVFSDSVFSISYLDTKEELKSPLKIKLDKKISWKRFKRVTMEIVLLKNKKIIKSETLKENRPISSQVLYVNYKDEFDDVKARIVSTE